MKKIFIMVCVFLLNTPSYAGGNISNCNNCSITYNVTKKVVKPRPIVQAPIPVRIPVAPPVVPVAPIGPGYVAPVAPYVAGPIYAAPYPQQPVAATVNGQCAWYVDPYDLFGQLFGNPDLVQSCW